MENLSFLLKEEDRLILQIEELSADNENINHLNKIDFFNKSRTLSSYNKTK